ncbi:hypothetical protein [Roseixanthobacter pseudopolyaromaticivorans]|uniref:hypothetical protein n=1 Tax=Xanthobacteraceae TaxID=335928 RepID=UPI0037291BA2
MPILLGFLSGPSYRRASTKIKRPISTTYADIEASCYTPCMGSRDEFSQKVKRAVAARSGWHCAMCNVPTDGPSDEGPDKVSSIGVAAHIAAAAPGPGARRYDVSMTPAERAGIGNAIWLCANDATRIDRDDVTYTVAKLQELKRKHERAIARVQKTGPQADLMTGLLAIGPEVVCTGALVSVSADSWTLCLGHFLGGDVHGLVSFIDGFELARPETRYVLSNELGDGRVLASAPILTKAADGFRLLCHVDPRFPRIEVQNLGSDMALHPDTGDLFLNDKGGIARVSGVEYLPQKVKALLSFNQGDNLFSPSIGVRFFEYFEAFRGSPWLDLLLKLEVVRQAAIPYQDSMTGRHYTPLRCVNRVRDFALLADEPMGNKIPVRIALDVQGVGPWEREMQIYMPTAEQMAERARLLAEMPQR